MVIELQFLRDGGSSQYTAVRLSFQLFILSKLAVFFSHINQPTILPAAYFQPNEPAAISKALFSNTPLHSKAHTISDAVMPLVHTP
jgi:hypothetical protein